MSEQKVPLKTVVETDDGVCPCPKCGERFDDMDGWTTHVSKYHDPFGEFVERWTRPEA